MPPRSTRQSKPTGRTAQPALTPEPQTVHDGPAAAASAHAGTLTPTQALTLQRLAGNHAVTQMVQREEERRPNRTGMPDSLKSGIESLSGLDMSDVRTHYNSPQPARLNALAYAQGSDIHMASGQERQLPHESWHVVQQAQGRVRPNTSLGGPVADTPGLEREADARGERVQRKEGVPVNDDKPLEQEADVMGSKAVRS